MLKLDLYKAAARFIERLPPKHRRQIVTKISELRSHPFPQDAKPPKGHAYPYFRADQGEYRIIYGVEATPSTCSSSASATTTRSTAGCSGGSALRVAPRPPSVTPRLDRGAHVRPGPGVGVGARPLGSSPRTRRSKVDTRPVIESQASDSARPCSMLKLDL